MRKTLIATAMLTAMSVVPSLHAAEAKNQIFWSFLAMISAGKT